VTVAHDPLAVPPVGEALLAAGLIDAETLAWALERQEQTGERLGHILMIAGKVHRLELQRILGEQWGMEFIDLMRTPMDVELAQRFDPDALLAQGWVPVRRSKGRVVVATCEPPTPAIAAAVRDVLGPDVLTDLRTTTSLDVERAVLSLFREQVVERSTLDLLTNRPELSAAAGNTRGQKATIAFLPLLVTFCALLDRQLTLAGLALAANGVFLATVLLKLVACIVGLRRPAQPAAAERIDDRDLPRYTVLVPVYREANVIGDLIGNLAGLDYPEEKLEVLVLLESDDEETIAAARAAKPPASVRLVVVPDAAPKTKPKACNVGLLLATGEHLVIYDAEDRPDPAQLRKAVAAFRAAGERTVCVQARLHYWNFSTNLLTRLFGLEYGYWFGAMLPGLDRLRLPIPLGGTSNHFRTDALRRLGGWDPHNVTEDADLGLRAAVEGYRVGVIDSWTDEEACSRVRPWIRQRTRWIKGYLQTTLVHTRSPIKLIRNIGPRNAIGFLALIGGTPLTFLLMPVAWSLSIAWLLLHSTAGLPGALDEALRVSDIAGLIFGNLTMIGLNAMAAIRERGWRSVGVAALNSLYWMLHSWAAWRALIRLVRNPFLWEKTPHGLDAGAGPPALHDVLHATRAAADPPALSRAA